MQDENEKAVRTLFEQWWNDNCADKPIVDYGYQTLTQDIAYHAFKAALQSQVSNTDGWVMVPVEPTPDMLDAWSGMDIEWHGKKQCYENMLSAAPQAPQQVSNTPQEAPNIQSLNICPRNSGHPHMFSKPGTIDSCRHCGLSEREWKVQAEAKLLAARPPQPQEQSGEAVAWIDEQWIDDTCDKIGDLYEKAGTPVKGLAPVAQALREAFAKGKAATVSQESVPGQEAVAPIGYIDRLQLERWERLRGTEFEVQERAYIGFSTKPFTSEMTDCTLAVYLTPPTSTAIAAMVIKEAAEALEPFALISSEGVIQQEAGHVTITTCAEYFHRARQCLETLTPANAEAELEALMMEGVKVAHKYPWREGMSVDFEHHYRPIVRRVLDEMKGE
jgi:hypothetical protein